MTSPDFAGMSDDDLRRLATVLQQSGLTFDPVTMRKATVTAVSLASTPPTVSILLSGDATTTIDDVRIHRTYTAPMVGDTALIIKQGKGILAWGSAAATPIGTTGFIEYARTTSQNISNNSITKIAFTTASQTDTSTITVASNTDFTLLKAGRYAHGATVPWASNANGSRWAWIGLTSDSSVRYVGNTQNPNNTAACVHNFGKTKRYAANTTLSVYAYQDSGVTQALFPSGVMPLDVFFDYLGP